MPVVHVEWLAGRDATRKRELAERVTAAVADVGGTRPEDVWVVFRDVPAEDWVTGSSPAP